MSVILHVSDLHFGPPHLAHVAEALLKAAHRHQPDLIVVSGDFTQHATPEQFLEAQHFLGRLPDVPQVVTPGNHDVPQLPRWKQLFSPFARYQQFIREELNYSILHQDLAVVSLNTTSWFGSWLMGRRGSVPTVACA